MTVFTVTVICIIVLSIFIETFRGYKYGVFKALLSFSCIMISVVASSLIAKGVSPLIANEATRVIFSIQGISIVFTQFPSLTVLIPAYVDAIITPFVFLILFFPFRAFFSLLLKITTRKILKNHANDPHVIQRGDSSKYGAAVGIISGFICAIVIISPFAGSMKMANNAVEILEKNQKFIYGVRFNTDELDDLKKYCSAKSVTFFHKNSKKLLYDRLATLDIGDEKISLDAEIKNIDTAMSFFSRLLDTFEQNDSTYSADISDIDNDLQKLSSSPTFKYITADFLSEASTAWLEGETYMNLPKFSFGTLIDPVVNEILTVCTKTTPDSAINDLSTILNIYQLVVQFELNTTDDYADILVKLNDGNVITELCNELEKNERMAYISEEISDLAVRAVAITLANYDFSSGEYAVFVQQLATSMNDVRGYTYEEQIELLSQSVDQTFSQLINIPMPEYISSVIAKSMKNNIRTSDGIVRPSDVINFFNSYS